MSPISCLTSLAVLLSFASAEAQKFLPSPKDPPPTGLTIEGTAAEYIRWEMEPKEGKALVTIDPRRYSVESNGGGENRLFLRADQAHDLGYLAREGVFEVATVARATECLKDPIAKNCLHDNRFRMLTFSIPIVKGDSATIQVRMFSDVTMLGRGSAESVFRFSLAKAEGVWHVVKMQWAGP